VGRRLLDGQLGAVADVVDEHAQPAEPFLDHGKEPIDVLFPRNVALDSGHVQPVCRELARRSLQLRRGFVDRDDAGALPCEALYDGASQPPRAARDDGRAAGESPGQRNSGGRKLAARGAIESSMFSSTARAFRISG
jgi:hypothetical protein